jgi:hypothetical protein
VDKSSLVAELPVLPADVHLAACLADIAAVLGHTPAVCWGDHVVRVGMRVGMMRCMSCGGEMILAGVKPDDTGMVAGFKHETLHCLVCRDTEQRFVYSRESSEQPELPPISALSQQPVISSTSVEAISSSSAHSSVRQGTPASPPESFSAREAIASVGSWGRAVEKLRSRQTDIKMRTGGEKVEKTDWNAQFNQAWEKHGTPPHKSPGACDATHRRPKHLVRKSARALRIELWGSSPTGNRTNQSAIDPPAASIERFKRFWDSLLPARHRSDLLPEASTTSAKPLPRSLSLVQVEKLEGVSIAGRAILLLRR